MDNINDIIASLSPEDIEALKSTAQSIFGSDSDSSGNNQQNKASQKSGFDIGSMLDPKMFANLSKIMSAMNSDGGKRCRLIEALKPNLSYKRQKKADEAMQIMKLLEVLPLLTNLMNGDDK